MIASYLLFAYNQERFVEAALRSALDQTYDSFELIVTDDGSTDATASIIEQILAEYRGTKSVMFNRRPVNGGLGAAINSAVALASAHHIVVAAGDDISLPNRTEVLMTAFRSDPQARCCHSNAFLIDENGTSRGLLVDAEPTPLAAASFATPMTGLLGATAAYHRDVFTRFGALADRLAAEDKVLPFRAAMLGTIRFVNEPLVEYRRHAANAWLGANSRPQTYMEWHGQLVGRRLAMVGVIQQRLDDIESFAANDAARATTLRQIRKANKRSLARLKLEHELLTTGVRDRKLPRALAHVGSRPGSLKSKWGWLKQFVWPQLYYRSASPEDRERAITRA